MLKRVDCTDEFIHDFNTAVGTPVMFMSKGPWLDLFTGYVTGDGSDDTRGGEPYYRPRFIFQVVAMPLLVVCFLASLSKKVDSFGLKIFCWNCVFSNAVVTGFVAARFIMLQYVIPLNECQLYKEKGKKAEYYFTNFVPNYQGEPEEFWIHNQATDDVTTWAVYAMSCSFLALRYTTYRACVAPLTYKQRYTRRWWIAVIALADLLLGIAVPFASRQIIVDVAWYIRYPLMIVLAGGIWIAECALTTVSMAVILRYCLTRNKSNSGGLSLAQLTTFLCFSVLPCLQVLPGVYLTLKEAIQTAAKAAADACVDQTVADLRAKRGKKVDLDYEAIFAKCGAVFTTDDYGSEDFDYSDFYSDVDESERPFWNDSFTENVVNLGRLLYIFKPFFEAFIILVLIPSYREALCSFFGELIGRVQAKTSSKKPTVTWVATTKTTKVV